MYGKGDAIQSWNRDQDNAIKAKNLPAQDVTSRAPVSTVDTISSSFSFRSSSVVLLPSGSEDGMEEDSLGEDKRTLRYKGEKERLPAYPTSSLHDLSG
jgi:hypothetical protein